MSPTRDRTSHDPKAIITDLQRQLAFVERTLDQRTAERDEALSEHDARSNRLLAAFPDVLVLATRPDGSRHRLVG
jgi:hypothetical protein